MKPRLLACVAIVVTAFEGGASAQDWPITIKNGETVELIRPSSVERCGKSFLASPPTAEMLVGHPHLSISLEEANVLPALKDCNIQVPGAILTLRANGITESSTAVIVIRWKYVHKDGSTAHRGKKYVVTMNP